MSKLRRLCTRTCAGWGQKIIGGCPGYRRNKGTPGVIEAWRRQTVPSSICRNVSLYLSLSLSRTTVVFQDNCLLMFGWKCVPFGPILVDNTQVNVNDGTGARRGVTRWRHWSPRTPHVVRHCDHWRKIDSRNNLVIIYASIEYPIHYSAQFAITNATNLLIIDVEYADVFSLWG